MQNSEPTTPARFVCYPDGRIEDRQGHPVTSPPGLGGALKPQSRQFAPKDMWMPLMPLVAVMILWLARNYERSQHPFPPAQTPLLKKMEPLPDYRQNQHRTPPVPDKNERPRLERELEERNEQERGPSAFQRPPR